MTIFSIYNFVICNPILVSEQQEHRIMKYTCILLLVTVNTSWCYYFYNPSTHDLIVLQSLNNVPKGYRLVPPPRDRKISRRTKDKTPGYCNDAGFTCDTPYNRTLTYQFECTGDDQCPRSYKCCSQKCFLHKVCVKASVSQKKQQNKRRYPERQGECETWPYHCSRPYHTSVTQNFECDSDGQCPRNFKCCQQNCFVHRICSRVKFQVKKPPKKLVEDGTTPNEEKPSKSEPVPQEGPYRDTFTSTSTTTYNGNVKNDNSEDYVEETEETTSEITSTTEEIDEGPILEATAAELTTRQDNLETDSETTTTQENTTQVQSEPSEDDLDTKEINKHVTETTLLEEDTTENDIYETTPVDEETTKIQSEVSSESENETFEVRPTTEYVPKRTTIDSNAINPEYAENFYQYDNVTYTYDDEYEYEDVDNYDDTDENK